VDRWLSLGSGRWYRREALLRAGLGPGMRVLDVCCGTGLVARAALDLVGSAGRVVGLDASLGMLARARRSPAAPPLVRAHGERLPVPDGRFDAVTMGYALRHLADLRGAFAELRRALRPGGLLVVLELTQPRSRLAARLVRLYLRDLVPAAAGFLTRDRRTRTLMRYFWDTIEACVPPAAILTALAEAGFAAPRRQTLRAVLSEYTAQRPVS
jgi:demethylmenaquinone methyltransferase/2-methoxy-6-polyprenyl-1,4-benzoquinol methylase